MKLWQELRRRRIFRLTGLYIVGAWLAMQVAATVFPAWDIPDEALRYLIFAAVLGFPVAMVFGWFFDITSDGIVRTGSSGVAAATDYSLKRTDYLILLALGAVSGAVLYGSFDRGREITTEHYAAIEKAAYSIAVLPFVNMNDDPDTEYFSDGVTEEILHRLSKFAALRVLGRSSSFAFKKSEMSVPKMSEILRVRYLLQGSVRREADQVRITAKLVDDSGFQVWSETFDRKLEGIFSIQSDIANSVAKQLVAEIAPREVSVGSTTTNMDAYQEYLIGRDIVNRRVPRWQQHASDAFHRAIDLDPDYAPPYAGLAVATGIGSSANPERFAGRIAEAQEHVDRALALDPELAEAHAAQGLLLLYGQNANFAASEAALRRAIELDPTVVIAYNWLNIALGSQGKREESRAVKDSALKIDPLNPILNANAALRYQYEGDFHRAEQILLRQMQVPEPAGAIYAGLFTLYNEYGRIVDAIDWAKRYTLAYADQKLNQGFWHLSYHYRYLGMNDEADYWYGKSVKDDPNRMGVFIRKTYTLKLQGKFDELNRVADEFLRQNPIDDTKLPVFAAQVLGAVKIVTGHYDEGIALTDRILDLDTPLSTTGGGGSNAIDFAHMLAYAYQKTDQSGKANEILGKAQEHLQAWIDTRARNPKTLELIALNQAMRGEIDKAVAAFESAVDVGWRHYYFVYNDPRWEEFREQPELKSLFAFVKADIDRQRKRMQAIDAQDDFRAAVEQLEAGQRSAKATSESL